MSALTPHIRVLRAEAVALTAEAQLAVDAAGAAMEQGNPSRAMIESNAATILVRLSAAKLSTADALEEEERGREATVRQ